MAASGPENGSERIVVGGANAIPSTQRPNSATPNAVPPPVEMPREVDPGAAIRPALTAVQLNPVDTGPAPVEVGGMGELLDRGRFEDEASAPLETEAVPGLIDSRLFAAYVPATLEVEALPDLESTSHDEASEQGPPSGAFLGAPMGEVESTHFAASGEVLTEEVPGLIDSTLFAAYTPAVVETVQIEGLEQTGVVVAGRNPARARPAAGGATRVCSECGVAHERAVCPACGARTRS